MLYACVGFQTKPCKPCASALQIIFFEKKPKKYGKPYSYTLWPGSATKNPLRPSGFGRKVRVLVDAWRGYLFFPSFFSSSNRSLFSLSIRISSDSKVLRIDVRTKSDIVCWLCSQTFRTRSASSALRRRLIV